MRFDLTVPLARFVAQHQQELGLPFKRYHIATVWRGENTQTGRYREFMQCDFDTIGTTDLTADIEVVLVINDLLTELGVGHFEIRVNHRGLLNGILDKLGLAEKSALVLRALDKFDKIGAQSVSDELTKTVKLSDEQARSLVELASLRMHCERDELCERLEKLVAGSAQGERGFAELLDLQDAVYDAVPAAAASRVYLEPGLARGLDYYTGIVVETILSDLPDIGSVASGGRYDNLAGLYTNQRLPGVGASLGLDRLLAALEKLGRLQSAKTPAPVLICLFDAAHRNDYLKLAAQLRAAGLGVEVFPEAKKLGKQLQYADRQGFRAAIVMGEAEFAVAQCQVKNLSSGDSATVPYDGGDASAIAAEIQRILAE
jgi:histidyl-tRNA synthetase